MLYVQVGETKFPVCFGSRTNLSPANSIQAFLQIEAMENADRNALYRLAIQSAISRNSLLTMSPDTHLELRYDSCGFDSQVTKSERKHLATAQQVLETTDTIVARAVSVAFREHETI